VRAGDERDLFADDVEVRLRIDLRRAMLRRARDQSDESEANHFFAEPADPSAGAAGAGGGGAAPTLIWSGPIRSCAAFAHLPIKSLSTLLGPARTWKMH